MAGSTIVVPPPYRGQYDKVPLAVLQSPYCEILDNFIPKSGGVFLRPGNELWSTRSSVGGACQLLVPYGTSNLFYVYTTTAAFNILFVDVTATGAGTVVNTLVGEETDPQYLYFNNYLFFFGADDLAAGALFGPQQYNGTAWAAAGYTWPASFNPFGGCVHKNRAYFIDRNSAAYAYSGIEAVSGATTKEDLTAELSSKGQLYIIRSIALTENTTQENVLAFLMSNGDVLVYGGSYPDSDSWGLVSRFRISNPLYFNSFVDVKGDAFILTETEVLSLRNLFLGGYEKERNEGIGAAIKNRYQQIVTTVKADPTLILPSVKGVYDEKNDRLWISFPYYVDREGEADTSMSLSLVFDFTLDAWYEVFQQSASNNVTTAATFFDGNMYNALRVNTSNNGRVFRLETGTDGTDDDVSGDTVGILFELVTAPLSISKFGASQITGVELILRSDQYEDTYYKFIGDLGRIESGGQTLADQGTGVAKPMVNVGLGDVTFSQLSISGETQSVADSIGIELYAFNVWYNSGEKGSR